MEQQYGTVGKAACDPQHEADDNYQLDGTDRVHDRRAEAFQEIEALEYLRRVLRCEELVQRPDQHHEEYGKAHEQQRYRKAIDILHDGSIVQWWRNKAMIYPDTAGLLRLNGFRSSDASD
ncbi:MAG: hypothetical protein U5K76_15210 [Woeseiaceae bacterium]|nr:hypothetical protein [Woeseiaceae bacterium]